MQSWINQLRTRCQCCAQGKDATREKSRRCAIGNCWHQVASDRTIRDAWSTPRIVLGNAIREELLTRNVAGLVRVAKARSNKTKPWSVEEARQFLELAAVEQDPLYAAYVLVLVLGLRRGEVLGLAWSELDLDAGDVQILWQIQRVAGSLVRRRTKTEASDAPLPLPEVCTTALTARRTRQLQWQADAGEAWRSGTGLVFTTRYGSAIEPRTFIATSRPAAARPRSGPSRCTPPAGPAPRSWWRWTCILAWSCRSCGTARSPSR